MDKSRFLPQRLGNRRNQLFRVARPRAHSLPRPRNRLKSRPDQRCNPQRRFPILRKKLRRQPHAMILHAEPVTKLLQNHRLDLVRHRIILPDRRRKLHRLRHLPPALQRTRQKHAANSRQRPLFAEKGQHRLVIPLFRPERILALPPDQREHRPGRVRFQKCSNPFKTRLFRHVPQRHPFQNHPRQRVVEARRNRIALNQIRLAIRPDRRLQRHKPFRIQPVPEPERRFRRQHPRTPQRQGQPGHHSQHTPSADPYRH